MHCGIVGIDSMEDIRHAVMHTHAYTKCIYLWINEKNNEETGQV